MKHLLSAAFLLFVPMVALSGGLPGQSRPAEAAFPAADLYTGLLFDCQPDQTVNVSFTWASSFAGPQWVDISLSGDFEAGVFVGVGPLPAGQSGLTWYGLQRSTWYFVRVNTLTLYGWYASDLMMFFTPDRCFSELPPPPGVAAPPGCPYAACVWTSKPDYASFAVGETVIYCYSVPQPDYVRIIATRPDGTSVVVVDGYVGGMGACVGPFEANYPLGPRTVRMYAGPSYQLLSETHFFVY